MIVGRMLAWLATAVTAVAVGAWLLVSVLVAGGPGLEMLQLVAPESEALQEWIEREGARDADAQDPARQEGGGAARSEADAVDSAGGDPVGGKGAAGDANGSADGEGSVPAEVDGVPEGGGAERAGEDSASGAADASAEAEGGAEDAGAAADQGGNPAGADDPARGAGEEDEGSGPAAEEGAEAAEVGEAGEGDAGEADAVDSGAVPPSVNWPDFAVYDELLGFQPAIQTTHFDLYAVDSTDPLLAASVARWAGQIETLHDYVSSRAGPMASETVAVLFDRRYEARCPARGLASPGHERPHLVVFLDDETSDEQVRAVLAHEIAHHAFTGEDFVGDGVLTEGLANWAAGDYALAWQGHESWAAAAEGYLEAGQYVSVADHGALTPREGEDCIARRDRIYNVRAAFVAWLVERYGLDLIGAMPSRTDTRLNALAGERAEMIVPDYEAATGRTLTQLEAAWLRELRGGESMTEDGVDRQPTASEGATNASPGEQGAP